MTYLTEPDFFQFSSDDGSISSIRLVVGCMMILFRLECGDG